MSSPSGGAADRAAARPAPALSEAVGGPRGVVETAAPTVAFLVAVTASVPVRRAALLALGVAVVLVAARAVARRPVAPAVTGAVMVGVCALVAARSGRATGFYAVGVLLNAAYALVLAASCLPLPARGRFAGGPVPLVGVVVATARGGGWGWRTDPRARRTATRLTWAWVGLFAVRLAVEVPLYLAGAATALGVARLALGIPLFAVLVWLTWLGARAGGLLAPGGTAEDLTAPPGSPRPERPGTPPT